MKAILIRLALTVLPDIIDLIIHALQELAHRSDNKIDDEIVAQIVVNKDKIVTAVKQTKQK